MSSTSALILTCACPIRKEHERAGKRSKEGLTQSAVDTFLPAMIVEMTSSTGRKLNQMPLASETLLRGVCGTELTDAISARNNNRLTLAQAVLSFAEPC